jgi:hypothetical protein
MSTGGAISAWAEGVVSRFSIFSFPFDATW